MMFGLPEPIQPVVFSFSLEAANSRPEMIEMGAMQYISFSPLHVWLHRFLWKSNIHLRVQISHYRHIISAKIISRELPVPLPIVEAMRPVHKFRLIEHHRMAHTSAELYWIHQKDDVPSCWAKIVSAGKCIVQTLECANLLRHPRQESILLWCCFEI